MSAPRPARRPANGRPVPAVAVASLYERNLVTRETGRAVRGGIERLFAGRCGESVAVLDFGAVAVIDFSCADEVVAKLVLQADAPGGDEEVRFVLVRGVQDHHLDPVECALRRRGLAVAAERATGEPVLLGEADAAAAAAFEALCRCGRTSTEELAGRLGLGEEDCGRLLAELHRRRLCRRCDDGWESLLVTASAAGEARPARVAPPAGE
ncbi:MAG: hypothetical protein RRA92_08895 [Gemmatimonadota bacterium]|nr:hypothetical protein [Gemmatimonadota bacterium]